jgi:tetratricopeptide (TPR) repeat protein
VPMTELLTFDFINLTKSGGELVLNWEKKQFPVKIEFAVDDIVIANAAEELKGPAGFSWQGYSSAANYAMQNRVNPDLGLVWADRAISMNRNFTTLMVKSNLLRNQGKIAEATNIETEALSCANEAEVNVYGYELLGAGKHDEAIRIFKINTDKHPSSANAFDSLGEAYFVKGDKEKATANFKKALTLNPNEATKANSMNYLKRKKLFSE